MNPLIERLGWTLLHSLWQGAAAWAALRVALAVLSRHSAQARYLAACGALVLATLAPWITFFQLDVTPRLSAPGQSTTSSIAGVSTAAVHAPSASVHPAPNPPSSDSLRPSPISAPNRETISQRFNELLQPAFPWLVRLWLIGFVVSCLRLLIGWRQIHVLTRGPLKPVPDELAARFASLAARLCPRRVVRICLSAAAAGPAVVGWLRPVVLLPIEALAGLTPGQIDALLIHELAHIRRADFLVNLLRAVTEALFFYHPAIRAINRLVRDEREHACDDLAVKLTGDPVGYARALASLASHRIPTLALAAAGPGETGGLLGRVGRLLGRSPARSRPLVTLAWAALTGAVLYLGAMLGLPALTARLLTPAERVALVKHTAATVAAQATPEFPDGARMTLVSEVLTEDGSPLPPQLTLTAGIQNRYRGTAITLSVAEGQVRQAVIAGELHLLLYAQGWAPTFAGPIQPRHADEELVIPTLMLRRGFPVRLRVTDEKARPLADVRLARTLLRSAGPAGNRNLNRPWPELVTDANGEAVFANVGPDTELEITFEHPGFQKAIRRFDGFTPDALIEFPLSPSHPTPGQVTDADTGLPIAGAQILLAGHQRPETNEGYSLTNNMRLTTTDEAGRFVLNTLNDRWTTYVYVTAPGYAPTSVEATPANPLHVRLDRGIRIAGRVRAAQGQLPKSARITAEYSLQTGPQSSFGHRPERPLDSLSPEPSFVFEHLPRHSGRSLSLTIAGRSVILSSDTDHTDVVIDLTTANSDTPDVMAVGEFPKRKVVLTLRPPSGEPVPEGELELGYDKHGLGRAGGSFWPRPLLPVSQGQVELHLPAPNRLQITQARLPGFAPVTRTFEIPDGLTPLTIDVPVVPGGAISGRLFDTGGTPVPDWYLTCRSDEPTESRASLDLNNAFWGEQKTNAAGGFLAGGLPFDHRYFIVAHSDFFYATSDSIRLTRRDPLHEFEWRLPPPATYRGRLVSPEGVPVPLASLELTFHARPDHTYGNSTRIVAEADGSFEIPRVNSAELDRYELKLVSRKAWQPFSTRMPRTVPAQPETLTVLPGYRVSGRVLDAATDRPLPNIELRAHPEYADAKNTPPESRLPILPESKTDAEGRFVFSTFPAGKFRIASNDGAIGAHVVILPAPAEPHIDLRLKPWARARQK